MENRELQRRGDSFDIGEVGETSITDGRAPDIMSLIQNPQALISSFDLNQEQAQNVKSLITATGTGLGHKWLSKHIGDELAGALCGFASGYIAKKLIGGK